jgi:negative regulator of flagellin synthesis FlgM
MISKIKDTSAQSIQQYQKTELTKNEADKQVGVTAMAIERVNLSSKAKHIQQIKQIVDQTPEIREEKVMDLKNQIESGSYTVNSEKIAEKMVGESLIDLFA